MAERDIFFRGKRIDNFEWIKGCLTWTLEKDRYFIREQKHGIDYEIIPETRGGFTGFYDKTGEEIFEDDIVMIPSGYSGDSFYQASTGIVTYDNGFYLDSDNWSDYNWNELVKIKTLYDDKH